MVVSFQCDPEAAESIFSNAELAAKTTLIPLDLTHQVLADKNIQRDLLYGPFMSVPSTDPGLNLRQLFHEILIFFAHTYSEVFGLTRGPPLHDPIAVAVLLDGSSEVGLFDDRGGERWRVKVVTDGLHSDLPDEHGQVGMTAIERSEEGTGVSIPRGLDVDRFWGILEHCMRRAEDAVAPAQTEAGGTSS